MLDIRMKDENTSWQEWYEENPRPRKYKIGEHGSGLVYGFGVNDLDYISTIIVKVDGRQINLYSCRVYSVCRKNFYLLSISHSGCQCKLQPKEETHFN